MKKINLFFGALATLFFISCEGPQGPPGLDGLDGPQGPAGQDGDLFEAAAFEIDIDLLLNTGTNTYEFGPEMYPSDITLIPDDVILVYRLEDVVDNLDVWRQLPQPFFTDQGLFYYNFDFTSGDYSIFAEPDFDANLMPIDLTQNQIFRIVIVPANLGNTSKIDFTNINSVMSHLGISEKDIQKIKLN